MKSKRSGRISGVLVTALALVLFAFGPASASEPRYGIGGSSSFPAGTEFALQPGQELPPAQSIRIQNTGNRTAEIEFDSNAPEGIVITPDKPMLSLEPGEQGDFNFAIGVLEGTASGKRDIVIQGKQTNVPAKEAGGLNFVPAFGVQLVVAVSGDSADVTIRAIDTNTSAPLRGSLTIGIPRSRGGAPVVIRRQVGTELTTRVAPGEYVAGFDVPGLTNEQKPFTITKDQTLAVDIPVTSVSFASVSANPKTDGNRIASADLIAAVSNMVKKLRGPVTTRVLVDYEGTQIDDVLLQQIPFLPTGTSEFRQSYTPNGGWQPGTYTFRFNLQTPDFAIDSASQPTIVVPSPFPWLWVAIGVFVLALLGVGLWLMSRRRRRPEYPA